MFPCDVCIVCGGIRAVGMLNCVCGIHVVWTLALVFALALPITVRVAFCPFPMQFSQSPGPIQVSTVVFYVLRCRVGVSFGSVKCTTRLT